MPSRTKGCHLIPYKGQCHSGAYDQNLLWGDGSVYVMDNHRAAAWCWAQHLKPNDRFSIVHIDQHTDLLASRLDEWCALTPAIETLSLEGYLALSHNQDGTVDVPLIRWDNYFSIFMEQRGAALQSAYFLTHCVGDKPRFKFNEMQFWHAPYNLAYWLADHVPWVVNIDMDYFFDKRGEGRVLLMFSDDYIEQLGLQIKEANDAGHVKCVTLAISPEICGGWEPGLHALRVFCRGLNLSLPDL